MKKQYHFVAISGSLRKDSYNSMVLRVMQKIAPDNILIEQLSISEVPFYNLDLHEPQFPDVIEKLNDAIKAADAVLFVSPEYNYSVPGLLKNTIDFISRSPKKPFERKPIGILGASTGLFGTARMQYHLRQIMVNLNAFVMNKPEVMIRQVNTKFDESGNLTDEITKDHLQKFMESLADFCQFLNRE
jgi:chromate reductase, NAD(P)H dehydrogenase (quinone)